MLTVNSQFKPTHNPLNSRSKTPFRAVCHLAEGDFKVQVFVSLHCTCVRVITASICISLCKFRDASARGNCVNTVQFSFHNVGTTIFTKHYHQLVCIRILAWISVSLFLFCINNQQVSIRASRNWLTWLIGCGKFTKSCLN